MSDSYEQEIARLREIIRDLADKLNSPLDTVRHLLGRELRYIDYDELDDASKQVWYTEAQALLNNRVFQSICGKTVDGVKINGEAVKDLMEYIARNVKNEQELFYWRAKICGIELVREMVERIPNPQNHNEDKSKTIYDVV